MNDAKRLALILCLVALPLTLAAQAPAKHAITFNDLMALERVSETQVSPDGQWVVYKAVKPDIEGNRMVSNIWIVGTASGSTPRQLTRSGKDSRPQWSPDGKRLAFLSTREGGVQIYLMPADGGEPTRLTNISGGADNELWSPDGKSLAFTSEVYSDCKDDACNRERDAAREKSKVKARIYDGLLYRHWSVWSEGKRGHLFIVSAEGGTPRDLTPGADYDVPPVQRGDAADIAISPDSRELCFTAVTDKMEAISTNGDLFTVPAAGGAAPKLITTNPGFDGQPAYSPDGKWIAYRSQARAGYESDKWRLMLYDRASGKHTSVNEKFDRSVDGPVWSPDNRTIYFRAEHQSYMPIYAVEAREGGVPRSLLKDGFFAAEFSLSGDGKILVFTNSSFAAPAEVFAAGADGSNIRTLTMHNRERLTQLDLKPAEHFWFEGAEGAKVQGMMLLPPEFDEHKKYPLIFLVHGGPQNAWNDVWGYRWNPQMFAAPGYVAVMINPRGSSAFGQKFTDEINADWGGKVFVDLMKGLDYVLAKYPFIDGARACAAGGSYGGYMMDWFASHAGNRFKCLISHAGVYDLDSMYGATEELWFPEWDLRGTPWNNPGMYDKWSPHKYAADFGKYKTPTLVIHGEQDYRVPYTQGLEFYTALQRQGVPSRLVVFPDEGHWISKPQNSELWFRVFHGWLAKYLK